MFIKTCTIKKFLKSYLHRIYAFVHLTTVIIEEDLSQSWSVFNLVNIPQPSYFVSLWLRQTILKITAHSQAFERPALNSDTQQDNTISERLNRIVKCDRNKSSCLTKPIPPGIFPDLANLRSEIPDFIQFHFCECLNT